MKFKYDYQTPNVIAEIGCNHMGNIDIAKELIELAYQAGAKYVKFQKRNNKELLTEEQYNKAHPVPENAFGETYGKHRDNLEFNVQQHKELKQFCEKLGVVYSTSVWDSTSAKQMIELNPEFLKVPSACNNNFDMLKILRDNFKGQIQLSIGMTKRDEVEEIVSFFEKNNSAKSRLLIYSCTSGYPVPSLDVSLLEINWLYENYGERVYQIGFSGHHNGIALDIAAYTLGARWIERHFTKNRTWKGTDHAASLEPHGLQKLIRNLNSTYDALNFKSLEILPIEQVQRDKLKNRK